MKPVTSNFVHSYSLGLLRPIIKSSSKKVGVALVNQLGFAKAYHNITHRRKGGRGPGLGKLPEIWGFPFNIYTSSEVSGFTFGTQLGFA